MECSILAETINEIDFSFFFFFFVYFIKRLKKKKKTYQKNASVKKWYNFQ